MKELSGPNFGEKLPPPPDQAQLTGYLSSLTPEQKTKLAQAWELIFALFKASKLEEGKVKPASGGFSFFGGGAPKEVCLYNYVDAHGQPVFHDVDQILAGMSPEDIKTSMWGAVMHDPPDSVLLRFLRARKWDVQLAVRMMCSTLKWRHKENVLDLVAKGDEGMEKYYEEKRLRGWRFQWTSGKAYFYQLDRWNRPICIINVRKHFKRDQDDEPMKKFTVLQIETARKMLIQPIETACVIFNMTDFTLANLDLAFVRYLIQCFEAFYPECLGACLIHNAPWFFEPCWKIIRPWLDPIVAAKIRFTHGFEGLADYIDPKNLQEEFGGENKWKYEYLPPKEGENSLTQDTARRDELLAAQRALQKEFEEASREWAKAHLAKGEEERATELWEKRLNELNPKLRQTAFDLEPYIRGRTMYHRYGFISDDQIVNFH
ncbi:uncharacterized protein VTP21DRAFT_9282 [Calcarisporiella thermophila]|uniref:uncharacterized protein n=1 Tax=Calcarisporiella thermophila TaxID=911321 RepID=UPI0037447D42